MFTKLLDIIGVNLGFTGTRIKDIYRFKNSL